MTISEMTDRVNALGREWEQFRSVNDRRLAEIEMKGSADPLYTEHLARIGQAMDQQKQRIERIETAQSRPSLEMSIQKKDEPSEYGKAFRSYLRKGMDGGLEAYQSKALSVGVDADGGYLVTPQMSETIIKQLVESSPMRQLASIETISTDSLELIDDHGVAEAGWVDEDDARPETDTPQIAKRTIHTFEMYAQPKATQKLVDDAAIDVEAWLAEKVGEIFARKEATAFISGNGTTQPKGILSYPAGTAWGQIEQVNSGSAGAVTSDGLIKLFYSLKENYSGRATFLINRSVLQSIRLLKDTTGQYIWQPSLLAGSPDTLLGVPVKMSADMPVAAANSLSVAVGDFEAGYKIVDRLGIRTLRDPFTEKPFIKFYTTKRVGGDVVNFDAIKLLKLAA